MFDIFISYCGKDVEKAVQVKNYLEENGLQCWFAPSDIHGNQDFTDEIPSAIENSKAFLLLLSADAMESKWVQRELGEADQQNLPIYTLFLEPCELSRRFRFVLRFHQHYSSNDGLDRQLVSLMQDLKGKLPTILPPAARPAPKIKKRWPWFAAAGVLVALAAVLLILLLPAKGMTDGSYVIWNPAYRKALTAEVHSQHYLAGVTVSCKGTELTEYPASCVWELDFKKDGSFRILRDGQALGMEPGYNGIGVGGQYTADRWAWEKTENGEYYIYNIKTRYYLEWYKDKNNWSTYNKVKENSEDLFLLRFEKVKSE